jgi:hypothetical protein
MTWIGTFILDENGNPIPCKDPVEWSRWFDRIDRRRVAEDHLGQLGRVSTVFLGLDHGFRMFGAWNPMLYRPVLWETMIFGGPWHEYQLRYTSAEAARRAHKELVSILQAPGWMVRYRELKGIKRPARFVRWKSAREGKAYVPLTSEQLSKSLRNMAKFMRRKPQPPTRYIRRVKGKG